MQRKQPWYNNRWIYLGLLIVILYIFYYGITNSTQYYNYSILEKQNVELKRQNDSLQIVAKEIRTKIEKTTIIRERISTEEEDARVYELEKQLNALRSLPKDTTVTQDSPEELFRYFNNFKR